MPAGEDRKGSARENGEIPTSVEPRGPSGAWEIRARLEERLFAKKLRATLNSHNCGVCKYLDTRPIGIGFVAAWLPATLNLH